MHIIVVLFLALAVDLAVGEPPSFIHPVVWMGKAISFLERGANGRPPAYQLAYGLGMVLVMLGLFVVPAYFALMYLKGLSLAVYLVTAAVLLKSTFSLRELRQAALRVKRRLTEDNLDEARFELRALVGRDTSHLPKPLLVSAAVESVAESASDGFVAPLFYFLLLGVPGAIAYRVVNTMDSMVGYHGKYEYTGKSAARLDDVLNFIPARLTALLLVAAAFLCRRNARSAWRTAIIDHARTASPNGGWPMAAIAGGLGVQLEKVGYHKLGRATTPLVPDTINASLSLVQTAAFAWVLLCSAVGVIHVIAA